MQYYNILKILNTSNIMVLKKLWILINEIIKTVFTYSESLTQRLFTAATFFGFFATDTWPWGGRSDGAINIKVYRRALNNFLSLSRPNTCLPIHLQAQIELPIKKSTICNKYYIYKVISLNSDQWCDSILETMAKKTAIVFPLRLFWSPWSAVTKRLQI